MAHALAQEVLTSSPGGAGFTVTLLQTDETRAVVALHGELDLANAGLLGGVLGNQLEIGRRFVRLDLSGLDFVDASGLSAIVQAHNAFLAAHGNLVLTGIGPRVARLIALTHLERDLFMVGEPAQAEQTPGAAVPFAADRHAEAS
jgi:anti-sigma B factor antagonist